MLTIVHRCLSRSPAQRSTPKLRGFYAARHSSLFDQQLSQRAQLSPFSAPPRSGAAHEAPPASPASAAVWGWVRVCRRPPVLHKRRACCRWWAGAVRQYTQALSQGSCPASCAAAHVRRTGLLDGFASRRSGDFSAPAVAPPRCCLHPPAHSLDRQFGHVHTHRQTDAQTDAQTGAKTGVQTDRCTDRCTYRRALGRSRRPARLGKPRGWRISCPGAGRGRKREDRMRRSDERGAAVFAESGTAE